MGKFELEMPILKQQCIKEETEVIVVLGSGWYKKGPKIEKCQKHDFQCLNGIIGPIKILPRGLQYFFIVLKNKKYYLSYFL